MSESAFPTVFVRAPGRTRVTVTQDGGEPVTVGYGTDAEMAFALPNRTGTFVVTEETVPEDEA